MLFADRFLVRSAAEAIDLATARRVWLRSLAVGSVRDQMAWSTHCDRLFAQPRSRLVDYGLDARGRRFEAWSTPGAPQALDVPLPPTDVVKDAVLAGLFEKGADAGPRVVALQGPADSERSAALERLARHARMAGYVPVALEILAASAASPGWCAEARALLDGRSVCLLADRCCRVPDLARLADLWRALLRCCLERPTPHVAAIVVAAEVGGLDRVVFDGPDPFSGASRARRALSPRVAEQSAVYRIDGRDRSGPPAPDRPDPPTAFDSTYVRRHLDSGSALLARGRHASGERLLRLAIGAAARRALWGDAVRGGLVLAGALAERGRARDAQAVLDEARDHAACERSPAALARVAAAAGRVWVDLARLDEADQVLNAGVAASAAVPGVPAGTLRLELARCRWWRGRFAEAREAIGGGPPGRAVDVDERSARVAAIQARVAVGVGDPDRALEWVRWARALPSATEAGGETDLAAAWVHLALGDLDTAVSEARLAIEAARRARRPLVGARARLVVAEACRRLGDRAVSSRALRALNRVARRLPPLVRAQLDLANALAAGGSAVAQLERQIAATGLGGLVLLVRHGERGVASTDALPGVLPQVIRILQACQVAEDERTVLRAICARLRRDAGAAGVATFVRAGAGLAAIASDGTRPTADAAERAVAAGLAIGPTRVDGPAVAAAPVVYGGEAIGALAVAWPLGSCGSREGTLDLLGPAAVAIAPIVAAALATQRSRATGATEALIGESAALAAVRDAISRAAGAPFPVLVEGESGSGKELVARALHRAGLRRDRPFVSVNCAALPEDLVEAELFGHARGAFTGAVGDRPGVFEEAQGGTLFLDEIGELSPRAQAKLLRVIQEGELRRVGENTLRRVDARLVAATNRDLRQDANAGRFRRDLLYRLDVVRICVPPLRERREDIAAIVDAYWRETTARLASRATLAAATVAALTRYDWPGNVRELQNVLAALAVRCPKHGVVPPTALPPAFGAPVPESWRLEPARRAFEERFVRAALTRAGGRQTSAARELGLSRQGLTKLMKRLGIDNRA